MFVSMGFASTSQGQHVSKVRGIAQKSYVSYVSCVSCVWWSWCVLIVVTRMETETPSLPSRLATEKSGSLTMFIAVHLILWGCSIHLYPDKCRLEVPSRGTDAKLLVTSSNHILVNFADFAGMEEYDYDVWTPKRGRESEETGTESEMTEGTEETITDPEEALAKRTIRGVPRKPSAPRKRPPPAYIQLSPALQSELRKLQHAAASAAECCFLTRDQDRWRSQQSTCVRVAMRTNTRTPRASARLRLSSVEPTRLSNVIMLKIMAKRLNNGSAKITSVNGAR